MSAEDWHGDFYGNAFNLPYGTKPMDRVVLPGAVLKHETDRAYLIKQGDKEVWVSKKYVETAGMIRIPLAWAEKAGMTTNDPGDWYDY